MTPHDHLCPAPSAHRRQQRSALGAVVALAAAGLVLSSCGVGGEPVDAGASVAEVEVEAPDCPAWVNQILASSPADSDVDADGWDDHFQARAATLTEMAEQLPAADADVIEAYADAVRAFGNDPMSPGASRHMGEAAADAAAVANRSC